MAKKVQRIVLPRLHNGEPRPDLQFPDPVSGDMIGGQEAARRGILRYEHCVLAWARRQGKTRVRQITFLQEATLTPGDYRAGLVLPDHTTAHKIWDTFKTSYGPLVKDAKGDDKSQDRWIEFVSPLPIEEKEPPAWFDQRLRNRFAKCKKNPNTFARVYFWGGSHPHYEKIQGFPFPFNRIDWDECAQIHPDAYGVVRPMLRDVRGFECFSGTPMSAGIGNVKFKQWWQLATAKDAPVTWYAQRIPSGTNPFIAPVDMEEARRTMTQREIDETIYARFLSGAGAVFTNIDRVCVLPFLARDHADLAWVRDLRSRFTIPTMEWWIYKAAPPAGHIVAASIDWARSPKGDYSAMTVMDMTTGEQLALFRWRGEDFTQQLEVVLAIQKHYRATQLHSDDNGLGLTMSDFMRRRHALGFVGHRFGRGKPDYVRRGQVLFQDRDVRLIDCFEQKREFEDFSAFESKSIGTDSPIRYSAPDGSHDDIVCAFLHLAPTLTLVGKQAPPPPPAEPVPMFDKEKRTTLELFTEGGMLPFRNDTAGPPTLDDVVLVR